MLEPLAKPRKGLRAGLRHIFIKRISGAYSWHLEIWQFQLVVKNESTIDAHGYVISFSSKNAFACFGVDVSYMREASAVARSTTMGKPEPQDAGRATDTDSSRFLFFIWSFRGV